MNIHEYQAKQILARYHVPVPRGQVAFTPHEAVTAAQALGGKLWVVKAQIHAGGRGKAGGVKLARSLDEVETFARQMLGMTLITHQTGPEGRLVKRVYVEQGTEIAKELYLSVVVDRATSRITFVVSTEGGMDIEEVAAKHPDKLHMVTVDPACRIQPFHSRKLGFALNMPKPLQKPFYDFVNTLYSCFTETDASQVEINPLVITKSDTLLALDAKFNFDDNALFYHQDIAELRDPDEEDPLERQAAQFGLSYIKMDGNIGCMVNGAGLAMATMDIIKLYGGSPANFLDVGGGANKEKVTAAFKLILSDRHVEGILVNIFGGIMRCDIIAEGIITAAREVNLDVPLVVRLEGTNVELGKKMLSSSGLAITPADNLADAAEKITRAVKAKKVA
ncbi:MAG: ADP-forming succinate--CoA ligase subunit beta [Alphaproteobacteria bacterium]|nr:ADP-forming succinate--CoA ligase subunit beta [Alphaproteobacteria bacterium]